MKLLRIWAGPMCAAKTTGALQVARRYARQGMRVVLIRPTRSRRSHEDEEGHLSTKGGTTFPSTDVDSVLEIPQHCADADAVWIDEPSLFEDEGRLPQVVAGLRKSSIILISGLGATSELEPFGQAMPYLLAVADEVNWAAADCDICRTHGAATRTLYMAAAPKDGQVRVGGEESYRPACPECWTRLMRYSPEQRRDILLSD